MHSMLLWLTLSHDTESHGNYAPMPAAISLVLLHVSFLNVLAPTSDLALLITTRVWVWLSGPLKLYIRVVVSEVLRARGERRRKRMGRAFEIDGRGGQGTRNERNEWVESARSSEREGRASDRKRLTRACRDLDL